MRGYSTGTGFRLSLITGICCSAAYTALHRHPGSMQNQTPVPRKLPLRMEI